MAKKKKKPKVATKKNNNKKNKTGDVNELGDIPLQVKKQPSLEDLANSKKDGKQLKQRKSASEVIESMSHESNVDLEQKRRKLYKRYQDRHDFFEKHKDSNIPCFVCDGRGSIDFTPKEKFRVATQAIVAAKRMKKKKWNFFSTSNAEEEKKTSGDFDSIIPPAPNTPPSLGKNSSSSTSIEYLATSAGHIAGIITASLVNPFSSRATSQDAEEESERLVVEESDANGRRRAGSFSGRNHRPCWMCNGSGTLSKYVASYTAPPASEDLPCLICWEDSVYGISTECAHFYCEQCIKDHIEECLSSGKFPAYCPQCAQDAGEGNEPNCGRIEGPALTFLQRRGVIDLDTQMRFLKQQNRFTGEKFFKCPAKKCNRYLMDCGPSYMQRIVKGKDGFNLKRAARPGRCECGALVCLLCHRLLKDEEDAKKHDCDFDRENKMDPETEKLIKKNGKKCPNCGMLVLKRGGCNTMMCGGDSHGKIVDAIKNGGCGHQFYWDSLKPANTFYIGIDGKRRSGFISKEYRLKALKVARGDMTEDEVVNFTKDLWKSSKNVRFVIHASHSECSCLPGRCSGITSNHTNRADIVEAFRLCPKPLLERGVTQKMWKDRIDELFHIDDTKSQKFCIVRTVICLLGWWNWGLGALPCCFLPWSRCDPFQLAIHDWLRRFNDEVLIERNMYVKAFSFGQMRRGGAKWEDGTLPVLVFALNPEEIKRLKRENVLQRRPHQDDPGWACLQCPCHYGRSI